MDHIWHQRVHELRRESLAYYQLQFSPTYDRERISLAIDQVLERNGVGSFCMYETYGIYDILLRLWLRPQINAVRFSRELTRTLADHQCTRVIPFLVAESYHWAWWSEASDEYLKPSEHDIETLDEQVILQIDAGNTNYEVLEELSAKHVLRRYHEEPNDVKFFVIIPPPVPMRDPTRDQEEEAEAKILQTMQEFQRQGKIVEPSLYVGQGFAWLLIKAKLKQPATVSSIGEFVDCLNTLGVTGKGGFGIRTYTYLTTGTFSEEKEGLAISESLSVTAAEELENIEALLSEQESQTLEVKGSLRFDVGRYISDPKHTQTKNDALAQSILKTIVAFLNTKGGTVVIGALEADRARNASKHAEEIISSMPTTESGKYIVCGVEFEYEFVKEGNPDGLVRLVVDLIRSHIGGDASSLVIPRIVRYKDKDLMILRVPKGYDWHYLDDKHFYVRRAGSTMALEGRERHEYQMNRDREYGNQ